MKKLSLSEALSRSFRVAILWGFLLFDKLSLSSFLYSSTNGVVVIVSYFNGRVPIDAVTLTAFRSKSLFLYKGVLDESEVILSLSSKESNSSFSFTGFRLCFGFNVPFLLPLKYFGIWLFFEDLESLLSLFSKPNKRNDYHKCYKLPVSPYG